MAKKNPVEEHEGFMGSVPRPVVPVEVKGQKFTSVWISYLLSIILLFVWGIPLFVTAVKSYAISGSDVLLWVALSATLFVSHSFALCKVVEKAKAERTLLVNIFYAAAAGVLIWQMKLISGVNFLDIIVKGWEFINAAPPPVVGA